MVLIIIILLILLGMWVYKKVMTKKVKIKLGVIQVLNDGAIVETMNKDIKASSELPFDGNLLASFFAIFLTIRESAANPNWTNLINAYLLKWASVGLVQIIDGRLSLSIDDVPDEQIERKLFEILNEEDILLNNLNNERLSDWGKHALALGETILTQNEDADFDTSGRIRFTRKGYNKSLSHAKFALYFFEISDSFYDLDKNRQTNELCFAILLGLEEEINKLNSSNCEIANMARKILSL